ncbi:TPA: hypothetical protein N0F65_005436 [Lagenidium giganteum]|uniref:Inosine/uridine-preferring nucleoside hydrolase domain-containing protein n=1 Tax=Lagenidium giganteum TaxID=4803 RepID=A0AAV2Z0Z0_9STRA|nr:TPA: hypothetical protein N0F65_005436 [Lagenidium giganteum]
MALRGFREDAIVGITTVFGNVDLPQANHNVDFLLQALDRADIPVASGANRPIISKVSDERWPGHGPDGLGGVSGTVDVAHAAATVNDAVTMLIEKAREHRGELIVIALGSLTNVALAMLMDPSLVSSLKLLVVMGATSRGMGNLTPHAEFNIGCDPEAAEIVLQHCTADTLYIVPFETAISSSLKWTEFNEMFNGTDSNTKSLVRDMWQVAAKRASSFAPCDAYAVATLLDPALITSARTVHGQIHLSQDQWRGFSEWEDVASGIANQSTSSASLVSAVDREIFKRLLESLVAQ